MSKKLIFLVSLVFVLGSAWTSPAEAADPNLAAWWKFDEGSGITAVDSSGNGMDGELVSNPVWRQDGKHKGCLFFDGAAAHVRVPDHDSLHPGSGSFTITFWVNLETAPGSSGSTVWDLPVAKRQTGSNGYYIGANRDQFTADEAGIKFMLGDTDGTRKDTGYKPVPLGEWVFVAAVLDRDNNVHKISVDGGQTWATQTPPPGPIAPNMDLGIGFDIGPNNYWTHGRVDDVALFNRALSSEELQQIRHTAWPEFASAPYPADGDTDVTTDVVLSWMPGDFAPAVNGHTIYISKNFEDVKNGVGGITLSDSSYAPDKRLDLETVYYWRVDEVSPDSTVFPGEVWSFTTEPVGYPIDGANITATASSSSSTEEGPENTINGSGLDDNDLHSTEATDMWLSDSEPSGAWIQYEFDKLYKLHKMWVWNSNQPVESLVGFGLKDVTIEYSTNGTDYTTLAGVPEFAQAPEAPDYAHNTTVDFDGAVAKFVRLTANSNWSGVLPQFGLSEVRFFHMPLRAKEPYPASGAADVPVDVTLGWRAGRESAEHEVSISTDMQAVIDGTAPVTTVTEAANGPLSLDLAQMYYWQIVEVNNVETQPKWQGPVWDFTTQEYLVVDDFESYNDIWPPEEGSNLLFMTWLDGYLDPTNGSTIGSFEALIETANVFDGKQSAPLHYDNTTAGYSEVTVNLADLPVGSDWTKHGIRTLSLWFAGNVANVPGQLYVKVNGVQVNYDGDASNLTLSTWQVWNIELASFGVFGVDLQNVTTISIGIGGANATGILLLDGIRLYPYGRELVTPVEPGTTGLAGYWKLDGDALDSSGLGNDGTPMGDPNYVTGMTGQALQLDGDGDYLVLDPVADDMTSNDATFSAWIKTEDPGTWQWWFSCNTAGRGNVILVGLISGKVTIYENGEEIHSRTLVNDLEWHHVAYTRIGDLGSLYIDGMLEGTHHASFNFSADDLWSIGQEYDAGGPSDFLTGTVDDIRIYDVTLSYGEIGWLAGKILPFDKAFED